MSVGVSRLHRATGTTLESLISEADTAMYRHKRSGLGASASEPVR